MPWLAAYKRLDCIESNHYVEVEDQVCPYMCIIFLHYFPAIG